VGVGRHGRVEAVSQVPHVLDEFGRFVCVEGTPMRPDLRAFVDAVS
jgi:hypothetical protein